MKYAFKINKYPVKAESVGKYFEGLQEQYGEVNPETMVENAKSKSNILHKCFEWDDGIAANKYRIIQANDIIRCLVVTDSRDGVVTESRAVVSVSYVEGGKKTYQTIGAALKSESARDLLLRQAMRDIDIFSEKYRQLNEIIPVIESMQDFKEKLNKDKDINIKNK